ncbi:tRNA-splicing endonuclease subunit sen54 [Ascosphaera acerosa]|nr:tRNA-splicing endonuclease subunit sen54 [Ascosphaera acerosa]
MADADEDAMLRAGSAAQQGLGDADNDISDETQDFRFLYSKGVLRDPSSATIPKRGEKDFEPNPTQLQSNVLAASRQAMHDALSHVRLHNEKTVVRAVFCPTGILIPGGGSQETTTTAAAAAGSRAGAHVSEDSAIALQTAGNGSSVRRERTPPTYAGPPGTCVCVPHARGQFFKNMGRADRDNRVWLLPEEAIYLVERGSLDIRFPAPQPATVVVEKTTAEGVRRAVTVTGSVEADDGGVPMSLQAAYALMLGRDGLTMERYTVYSGLKRSGYAVVRAGGWSNEDSQADYDVLKEQERATLQKLEQSKRERELRESQSRSVGQKMVRFFAQLAASASVLTGPVVSWKRSMDESRRQSWRSHGPVIGLGIYRDYPSIYRALSLIPTTSVDQPSPSSTSDLPPLGGQRCQ